MWGVLGAGTGSTGDMWGKVLAIAHMEVLGTDAGGVLGTAGVRGGGVLGRSEWSTGTIGWGTEDNWRRTGGHLGEVLVTAGGRESTALSDDSNLIAIMMTISR